MPIKLSRRWLDVTNERMEFSATTQFMLLASFISSSFVHKIIFPVQILYGEMEAINCVKEMVLTGNK